MANQIPLLEGTNAAGGYLVPQVLQEALISKINRQAAALSLSNIQRINSNRASWPVYLGRPAVGIVGEGATKGLTGAEFSEITVAMKKVAGIAVYTEELLEDARIDPTVLVNDDIEKAFSDFIDKGLIGTHPGGASTQAYFDGSFANAAGASQDVLSNTTQSVEYDASTNPDAFALALSNAMEQVEANGYEPNGIIVAFTGKRLLRDARDTTKRPLYSEGFVKDVNELMGMNLAFSTNLTATAAGGVMGGAGSPGKVLAIVGDFSNSKAVIRKDITMRTSTEATLTGGHNLFEQNKTATLWEMRMGYTVFDLNRAFCKIVNSTGT